jgi:hypothetical protein
MMRRRKPVPAVEPAPPSRGLFEPLQPPRGNVKPAARPSGRGQAEPPRAVVPPKDPPGPWDRRLPTPAELEADHLARDLGARAQLAEVLRPFDRPKRREFADVGDPRAR